MTDVDQQREWEAAIICEREGRFAAETERDDLRLRLAAALADNARLRAEHPDDRDGQSR